MGFLAIYGNLSDAGLSDLGMARSRYSASRAECGLKDFDHSADSVLMEPELKKACWNAAVKLGIGLTLVVAVIGIRLVSVTSDGVPAAIEKLDALNDQLAEESAAGSPAASRTASESEGSIVARLSAGVREHFTSSNGKSRDGERLVSCRLSGRTQFMRADDCAVHGGASTDVGKSRSPR
jgi:hypothetical protein